MAAEDTSALIREQAQKITESGVLGRSRSYRRLFAYLVENTLIGRRPKEVEIAVEVFSRDKTFDPSTDSMVRVYAHNLRQKIRQYYEGPGAEERHRLSLPRGEYRLMVDAQAESEPAQEPALPVSSAWQSYALPAVTLIVGVVLGFVLAGNSSQQTVEPSLLWEAFADDDIPIQVVVGDYFIFGELDETGVGSRFVREFAVNSPAELDAFSARSGRGPAYQNLDLTYLAQSTAPALGGVLSVLHSMGKPVEVVAMSEFDPGDVRNRHIVYVGYFSALDKLFDFAFAGSQLEIGSTYDELIRFDTGDVFASSAGLPNDYRDYIDFGYFSTFPGPGGNQLAIVAGTRDEGVMHIAQVVSDPAYVPATVEAVPASAGNAFELLYEVTGFDRTHIDAMLVHAAPLDDERIWLGGALRSASSQ